MSLKSGLQSLRQSVVGPEDALYQRLTDLITALEEATLPVGSSTCPPLSLTTPLKLVMGPPRSREGPLRMKKSPIGAVTPLVRTLEVAAVCRNSPRSSSGDDRPRRCEGTAVEPGSDTDCPPLAAPHIKKISTVRRDRQITEAIASGRLRPPPSHLVESDSFPETFTPATQRLHRRKRFIKRMSVDIDAEGDIMDVDEPVSPHVRTCRKRPQTTTDRSQGGWDVGMDYDLDDGSSISSSDNGSSDDGRQGDDEQSDWVWEATGRWSPSTGETECMGIPAAPARLGQSRLGRAACDFEMAVAAIDLDDQLTPPAGVVESSDTDRSQSSSSKASQRNVGSHRRWLARAGAPLAASINRKFLKFLRNPDQEQLTINQLRKGEKREVVRLANFYRLEMAVETKQNRRCLVFRKTGQTTCP
uniref:Uncharacterized protein n=1 Tax=Plectus sambesii TaxID=2011161 RepID=A0A914WDC7_9BILA